MHHSNISLRVAKGIHAREASGNGTEFQEKLPSANRQQASIARTHSVHEDPYPC